MTQEDPYLAQCEHNLLCSRCHKFHRQQRHGNCRHLDLSVFFFFPLLFSFFSSFPFRCHSSTNGLSSRLPVSLQPLPTSCTSVPCWKGFRRHALAYCSTPLTVCHLANAPDRRIGGFSTSHFLFLPITFLILLHFRPQETHQLAYHGRISRWDAFVYTKQVSRGTRR